MADAENTRIRVPLATRVDLDQLIFEAQLGINAVALGLDMASRSTRAPHEIAVLSRHAADAAEALANFDRKWRELLDDSEVGNG
jgi:hypothetical protein